MRAEDILLYCPRLIGRQCDEIKVFGDNPALSVLASDLNARMNEYRGIGIAAPQCGIFKRLCLVRLGKNVITLVNPKITEREEQVTSREGCLSLPNVFEIVPRWRTVKVRTRLLVDGIVGEEQEIEAEDTFAIVLQHELDHLDGKFFIDHLKPVRRSMVESKFLKDTARRRKYMEARA